LESQIVVLHAMIWVVACKAEDLRASGAWCFNRSR
jgi:hypothetical protein